jgi:hypothetical protein
VADLEIQGRPAWVAHTDGPTVNTHVEFYLRDDLHAQIISPFVPRDDLVRVGEGLGLR